MDVNRTNAISPLGPGSSRQERARDSCGEKQDKSQGEESPWEGTEAFAIDGFLANGLSPEIQKAFEDLTREIELLRAEVDRAKTQEAHFKELAETHSFLPLPGRREFCRELIHVLSRMEGRAAPSLIILHLVNADDIRRRLGRRALDGALIHVCAVIDTALDSTDVAGSLGGNDFGIIQLVSDLALARKKAEGLIKAISAKSFMWQGKFIPLNAISGVATLENMETPEAGLNAADKDLIGGPEPLPDADEMPDDAPPTATLPADG